jgi:hypothetical protein
LASFGIFRINRSRATSIPLVQARWVCFLHISCAPKHGKFARNRDPQNEKISIGEHYLASFGIFSMSGSILVPG